MKQESDSPMNFTWFQKKKMQTNSKEARYDPFYILTGKSCYYWLQWESEAQAEEMITYTYDYILM